MSVQKQTYKTFSTSEINRRVAIDDWHGCYREGWADLIVPEAYSHPAKYARGLIRKIYTHAVAEGWCPPRCKVIDPFGGVALGGFDAAYNGARWLGCELEARFVDLGTQNIAGWNKKFLGQPRWGSAQIIQGDSRKLCAVVDGAHHLCVSSPPFGEAETRNRTPYQPGEITSMMSRSYTQDKQGATPSNLGNAKATAAGFDLAVSPPPFSETMPGEHRTDNSVLGQMQRGENKTNGGKFGRSMEADYGDTPGQLGAMRSDSTRDKNGRHSIHLPYGDTPGNVGNNSGEDFWLAARQIVTQVYQILHPGAHAIWVVKGFVRKGALVDFPGQWAALCDACGFTILHLHRAHLIENSGAQLRLDGDTDQVEVARKSFFRRLAESKGSPAIDFETVLCMRRV